MCLCTDSKHKGNLSDFQLGHLSLFPFVMSQIIIIDPTGNPSEIYLMYVCMMYTLSLSSCEGESERTAGDLIRLLAYVPCVSA